MTGKNKLISGRTVQRYFVTPTRWVPPAPKRFEMTPPVKHSQQSAIRQRGKPKHPQFFEGVRVHA